MAKKKAARKVARRTKPQAKTEDVEQLKKRLAVYEGVFGEVDRFIDLIANQEAEIVEARAEVNEAKAVYDEAKRTLADACEARDGTKHSLFMFLRPGPTEIMPLFDRMEEPDEEKHGENASEWRKEPIATLRLSLIATNCLTAADVMLVGQLQDRMQSASDDWWESIEGLNKPMAFAIADKLTEFINERTSR